MAKILGLIDEKFEIGDKIGTIKGTSKLGLFTGKVTKIDKGFIKIKIDKKFMEGRKTDVTKILPNNAYLVSKKK